MSRLDVWRSGLDRPDAPVSPLWTRPWVIVATALTLRLLWAWLVPVDPVSDSLLYEAFARSIAAGKGYAFPAGNLTAYWPVGTSAVYAALYGTFGSGLGVIAVFQALLGALIVGLTWRLARDSLGPAAAALAGWFTALWPLMVEFTTILASELLFVALLMAALNLWVARRIPAGPRAVLWGACIAAATYVRPTAWPMLLIFPVLAWILDRQWRTAVVTVLVSTLTACVLFAPWVYRNYLLFDRFVLVAANSGPNLWMGNNPASNGGYMDLPDRAFANEVERDRYFGREAVAFIKSHPLDYVKLSLRRAVATYDRESIGVVWNEAGLERRYGPSVLTPLKLLSSAYWWSILVLGLFGTVVIVRQRLATRLWPVLAAFLFFGAVPILTVAQDRYHVPINPLLAIFGAWGALALLRGSRISPGGAP